MSDEAESSAESDEAPEPRTLLDTIMRRRGRGASASVVFVILGLGGLLLGGAAAFGLAAQPWELDPSSPVAESLDSECGPLPGGRFFIEVEGDLHACYGSDTKCGDEGPVAVAYDPEDPSRCRVAAHVDGLSVYELQILILALAFLSIGTAGVTYNLSERLRFADILEGGAAREARRGALRRCSGAALILGFCLTNGFALFFLFANL